MPQQQMPPAAPWDITHGQDHPCISEGCFCPKDPRAKVSPRRPQGLHSLILLPGPFTSSQPPPIHFPSAPQATESKVSKFGAILHSSGFAFFLPSFIIAPLPLLKSWQNYCCVLAREKRLARYCQLYSQNSGVFSSHGRESCC